MTARACLPEPPCDCLIDDVLARLGLPVLGEGGVEVLIELARRIVGDVEQRRLRLRRERRGQERAPRPAPACGDARRRAIIIAASSSLIYVRWSLSASHPFRTKKNS